MSTFDDYARDPIYRDNEFGDREVGLTHPDMPGFIRVRNNGDIEIVAGEELAIILNLSSKSITFVADHIKFVTQDEQGLRWNRISFNNRATKYTEPTFLKSDDERPLDLYEGVQQFVLPEDTQEKRFQGTRKLLENLPPEE